MLVDLIKLMRPKQWTKNIFVYTGLIFTQQFNLHMLLEVSIVALSFCFVSSCGYIINDIFDRDYDRNHPKKKFRPIASGKISVSLGIILAIFLGTLGFILGFSISYEVVFLLFLYVLLNFFYSIYLKNIVILDVFCIAAGFMLRILAGTVGIGIPPSKWLLLCGLMITLFLGFTKRRSEMLTLKYHGETQRRVLNHYGPILLDEIIAICATGTIVSYSLYTMSAETVEFHHTKNLIYTVPFVIYALFRYIYLLHQKKGAGDPSTDLFKDKHITFSVIGWIITTFLILHFTK